jgi:hypothetical protein
MSHILQSFTTLQKELGGGWVLFAFLRASNDNRKDCPKEVRHD